MENHGLSDIVGPATYMTTLANTYGLATQYTAVSHPSEPNYLALVGGDTFGISSDGVCCWTINSPNIVDRIENAGLTWQAWAEDASGSGTCRFSPPRSADHFGFLEFSDINTTSRCGNFHSTQSSSDSEFVNALNNSPSNLMWLTPNDCNNMHDCPVTTGDTYLAGLVPKILTSNLFTTEKAALFIVFDEGNKGSPNDYVYSLWAGSAVKKAYQSSSQYSHYSFLRTIEANWNLPSLTSNDANAPAMTEFFSTPMSSQLQASFTETPKAPNVGMSVTFTAIASGGNSPYTYSWTYGDNGTGSGISSTHAYGSIGNRTVTLTVQDSSSPSQTTNSSQIVTVSSGLPSAGVDFGTCMPLPKGWRCGNTNGLTGSSATIVNGVLETRESNPNVGNDSRYYYSTGQKGTFPWSPCQAPANGTLPTNITTVSTTFTPLVFLPSGSYRYHLYVALYYWLPKGPVVAGSSSYRCLDTQVRVQNINGTFSRVGTTATYNPGDSFGWSNVTVGEVAMGQTYSLTANVENQCRQDLMAWGLDPSTPCQLAGIEIGTEGYQFRELDVNWLKVNLVATAQPGTLAAAISATPNKPHAGETMSFSGSASGGTGPYTYSWSFGDEATAFGPTVNHAYPRSGDFRIALFVTDSSAITQTYTATQVVHVNSFCVPAKFIRADVNHDGQVDSADVAIVAQAFQSTPSSANWNPSADVNQDGIVDIVDVAIIAFTFGQSVC
ncbi:MAG TPA: PKD domain-containing protein [Candidatus Bathyarchaeia archaeon]|nr:PKD domain-containing protein [Candidatus Bathyarchaeia archaeon]